jgi:nitroimidazol reductase NimA-like FMN-containing flavoprotein (pyridoxamine 5'-phosphate oxidase superfamily)
LNHEEAKLTLRNLLDSRYVGVLATSKKDWPYANLVAFAVSDKLSEMVFATPRQSRKYENLAANPRVSVLIDDRSNDIADLKDAVAATAVGSAVEVDGSEKKRCLAVYAAKHPHLDDFARSASTAVFLITVEKYIMVSRFRNVVEIAP